MFLSILCYLYYSGTSQNFTSFEVIYTIRLIAFEMYNNVFNKGLIYQFKSPSFEYFFRVMELA